MLQLKIAFTWKKVPLAFPDLATSVSTQPSWSQELCRPWYCLFLLVTLPFLSLQLVWIFFPQEIKTLDEAFLPIAVLSQRPFASESNFYSETPARAETWLPVVFNALLRIGLDGKTKRDLLGSGVNRSGIPPVTIFLLLHQARSVQASSGWCSVGARRRGRRHKLVRTSAKGAKPAPCFAGIFMHFSVRQTGTSSSMNATCLLLQYPVPLEHSHRNWRANLCE